MKVKVYIVTSGEYSDYTINAVFDDLEQAEIFCATHEGYQPEIEEWDTTDDIIKTDKAVKKIWIARIGDAGGIYELSSSLSFRQIDRIDKKVEHGYHPHYGYYEPSTIYTVIATLDKNISEEKAKKIICDRLAKWKYEQLESCPHCGKKIDRKEGEPNE